MSKDFLRVEPPHIHDRVICCSQITEYYCGPACVQMILMKHGKMATQDELAAEMGSTFDMGTYGKNLIKAMEDRGLHTYRENYIVSTMDAVKNGRSAVLEIAAYGCGHFVLLIGETGRHWIMADPVTETGVGFMTKVEMRTRLRGMPIIVTGPLTHAGPSVMAQRIPI